VDVLTDNLISAARIKGVKKVALAGGVAANSLLRSELVERPKDLAWKYFIQSRYFAPTTLQ